MACYVALYIVHARVTDFDIVPIKDLVEWVLGWKMLVDELKESLSEIFNRNNIKVSYSCMDNVKSNITRHNHRLKQKPLQSLNPKNVTAGNLTCVH